jgi:ABC-2 type transport system ATP-binding protein
MTIPFSPVPVPVPKPAPVLTPIDDSTPPPPVELRGVTKRYGTVEALSGVDLVVRRGEITAILGPNGAGKTTALSLILGLRRPDGGSVRILGGAPGDPSTRARVGAMLQESGVPPMLTVAELVDLFRSYYPTPRRAADILAAAGLTRLERRRAGQLSGGETQRLYFALALCGDPELLVLDEPTTSLDVQSRLQFWTIIGELAAKGTTILFATHLLEEADALATRIVVIDRGRILRQGTPAEVKAHAGGKTIRVRGDIDPEDVLLWPGVRGVERVGARYEIVATDAEAVLRRLFAGTAHVEEVTVEERALETAFLSLIKESN